MASKPTVLIVGTLDTKLEELQFLRSEILTQHNNACQTKGLDVSRSAKNASAYSVLAVSDILTPLVEIGDSIRNLSRGEYVQKAISECVPIVQKMVKDGEIHGIISAGGSSGTALGTALMRACPLGFPKLMVSTMASGDVKGYIEETDITMMYSVVDIAGLNSILRQVLSNAAAAISGMAIAYQATKQQTETVKGGKRIAVTMFGVTTPCVDNIRRILTSTPHDVSEHEVYVFHATGSGGRAMERLVEQGGIDAVIDLTTTEVADELFGGVLSAGPSRLEMAAKKGIPYIVSVGACDMVNFGNKDSVPEKYKDRKLFEHGPNVTLMRTSKEENEKIGQYITSKLKSHAADSHQIRVILPLGGVSMLDKNDQPFHDIEADAALFETISRNLDGEDGGMKIEVLKYPLNINDEEFAAHICEHLLEVMKIDPRSYRLANFRRRKWSFDHGKTIEAVRKASSIEIPDISST